ncbi:Long-chain-fatty-acid--CoA ligase [hydrothermal vent metagenome]|uniref:Long-chain-fatty-acid--CoA ligase n=1 Tax=hydrothermal vent metagenome TaxID=652676 RepID=A0A3B0V600_9ZZZZ
MEITRLFDVAHYQLENYPTDKSLNYKEGNEWKSYSTQDVIDEANKLSAGLIKKGVQPGDKVALVSFNRPEWVIVDMAIEQIGAISVPLYPNITVKDYNYTIEQSETKLAFVGDKDLVEKVTEATKNISGFDGLFSFDTIENTPHWQDVQVEYDSEKEEIEKRKAAVKPNDLATIIYTSGTTGFPKGVMLTHHNILSNSEGVAERFEVIESGYRALSFLPLCHIFERTASYTHMRLGVEVYFTSIENIGEAMKEIQPHYFATVPRLLEKVYDKIVKKGYDLKGIKKSLFFWALKLGEKYDPNVNKGWWYNKQLGLANKIIFSKWREALGGNILFIISGAAALQPRLARVFWAAQIPLLEAYGLTETSPGISFSKLEKGGYRLACVGPLLKDVKVKIADDGEILAAGPGIMQGYYKLPEETAEVLNDGWFSTGDIGEYKDGFLKITDRKKEIFKTSGGKYIAPQQMENKFKESMYIEQIMVVGEGQKHPSALIVPDYESVSEWCKIHHSSCATVDEMMKSEKVRAKFDKEIEHYNQEFANYERIKKYTLMTEAWSIEGGELTPTLKLKRKNIMAKYEAEVADFYKEEN